MKITNKDNRQTQENFESVDCGYQNNADVVQDYYVSTLKAFDGYFSLYLNKETGEIFESYGASRQNTWLEGDDIVRLCGTSALCGADLNEDEIETFEMWCGEWYTEWFNGFFEPTLADAIDYI